MKVKEVVFEDFVNYKKACMFIAFPRCTFKCDVENGSPVCQNSELAKCPNIDIDISALVEKYIQNPMTHAIVCGGLEPLESAEDLLVFCKEVRKWTNDEIVIYTGFTEEEAVDNLYQIFPLGNIVVKYGRFKPGYTAHYDDVLGVNLMSDNQYAKRYF